MSDEDGTIEFAAKYKNWVAIKKMKIDESTKPEEVSLHLSSIRQTLDRKAFEIVGIDTAALDAYSNSLTEGKRKSFGNLSEILQNLGKSEAKDAVTKACGDKKEMNDLGYAYLYRKISQNLGFDFDVTPDMLQKAFPGLKIPKPLGRRKKGQ